MCGICGIYHYPINNDDINDTNIMLEELKNRGNLENRYYHNSYVSFGHKRLAIIDLKYGDQPFTITYQNITYTIVYNGEIYNYQELKKHLLELGYHFNTSSDVEVLLMMFIAYREKCLTFLEGIFSFAISYENKIFLARDFFGIKPLYYTSLNRFLFASKMSSIIKVLKQVHVSNQGLMQLLSLGPSVELRNTIYDEIKQLEKGHYMIIENNHIVIKPYYKLNKNILNISYEQAVKEIRHLVIESIQNQLVSDVNIGSLLSGGLDSSIITIIASMFHPDIQTYSVHYENEEKDFKQYSYQTTLDKDYIQDLLALYRFKHHSIVIHQKELVDALDEALFARDMPGMVDVDSSLYLFSKHIVKDLSVVLSGECADELFGGYPWYYKKQLQKDTFPWILKMDIKKQLLNKYIDTSKYDEYLHRLYDESYYKGYNHNQSYMHIQLDYFMQTLTTRIDTMTMQNTLECRVPFASYKLFQLIYSLNPDYMLCKQEKQILRDAFKNELPESIYKRKKNPYPKTHSDIYTKLVCSKLLEALENKDSILYKLFKKEELYRLIKTKGSSFNQPWYGQLMMGPQMIAYLYTIDKWYKEYPILMCEEWISS